MCTLAVMARKPRIHLPGGIYHVMLRGNGGQEIFLSDDDRCHFLLLLQEGVVRFGHRVHTFLGLLIDMICRTTETVTNGTLQGANRNTEA